MASYRSDLRAVLQNLDIDLASSRTFPELQWASFAPFQKRHALDKELLSYLLPTESYLGRLYR